MTHEEALYRVKGYLTDIIPAEDYSEVEEIIKALEQQPCDDAVSRVAVCEIISDIRHCISVEGYCAILERLKKLPPVTPQQKYGKWIDIPFSHYFKCSECDKYQISATNYCPNCGARMAEPHESE